MNNSPSTEKKQFTHARAVKRDKIIKRTPSTSIFETQKQLEKKKEEKLKEEDLSNKPTEPFQQEELTKFWIAYADILKQKGKGGMHSTLNKYLPKISDNSCVIQFDVDSELQKIEFQKQSKDFVSFLRKNLNNYSITIKINVLAQDEGVKIQLGSKEKFVKMTEKNPDLKLLRDQFNLDIEY